MMMLVGMVSAAWAQVDDVTLVVSGEGATKDEATTNALRNAIEQAFGVFVSANTEILNDELVRDEIVTVSSGNVKKYKELGNIIRPDGKTEVSLSATVSVKKITSYAKNHGSSVELAGATFAANMKLRALYRKNSEAAIAQLFRNIRESGDDIWDCELKVGDVKSDGTVPVTLKYKANEKAIALCNMIEETFVALSISDADVEMMKKAGEKYYTYDCYLGNRHGALSFYSEVVDKEREQVFEKWNKKINPIIEKICKIPGLYGVKDIKDKRDKSTIIGMPLGAGDWEVSRYYTRGKIFNIFDNLGNKYEIDINDWPFEKYYKIAKQASKYVDLSYMIDDDNTMNQQRLYIGLARDIISIYNGYNPLTGKSGDIRINEEYYGNAISNFYVRRDAIITIRGTIKIPVDRIEKITNLYIK